MPIKYGILTLVLMLAGCVSPRIMTDNTAFFVDSFSPQGSIWVVAADEAVNSSLEFIAYKKKFEEKLAAAGYRIVGNQDQADYIALASYGIGSSQTKTVTTPIWGTVGFGTRYYTEAYSDAEGNVTYARVAYSIPVYGVVGAHDKSYTSYDVNIAMDIVEADSFQQAEPKKIYEGRTKGRSRCAVVVEVFDELLEAMFTGFPGDNGHNRKLTVPGEFNC